MGEWLCSNGGMILTGEIWSTGRKTCSMSLRLPKILHVLYLEWNLIMFCHRPTTNCTMHATLRFVYLITVFRRISLFGKSNHCSYLSVRLSAYQRGSHWMDLFEIWYWALYVNIYHWIPNVGEIWQKFLALYLKTTTRFIASDVVKSPSKFLYSSKT